MGISPSLNSKTYEYVCLVNSETGYIAQKALCPVSGTEDEIIVVPPLFRHSSRNAPHDVPTHIRRCLGRTRLSLLISPVADPSDLFRSVRSTRYPVREAAPEGIRIQPVCVLAPPGRSLKNLTPILLVSISALLYDLQELPSPALKCIISDRSRKCKLFLFLSHFISTIRAETHSPQFHREDKTTFGTNLIFRFLLAAIGTETHIIGHAAAAYPCI